MLVFTAQPQGCSEGKWDDGMVSESLATQPWIEANTNGTEGTYASGGAIYSAIVTGRDAYGIPKMEGLDEFSPKIIIHDQPDKADPLNQFISCGWKSFWAAKTLNDTWSVVIRCQDNLRIREKGNKYYA